MLEKIVHNSKGFVQVEISGDDKARFINSMIKQKINIWDYRQKNGNYIVAVDIKNYRKLRRIRQRYSVQIKLVGKKGFPFKLNLLRGRWGLLSGAILAIVLYVYLSSCYWVIDVQNNGNYTDEYILEVAEECGLYEGVLRSSIDERKIINNMMINLPEVSWISVNTYGSVVSIELVESDKKPEFFLGEEIISDLVATKTGVIRLVEAQQGVPLVKEGDAVKPGDVLVTGLWDSNRGLDEWSVVEDPIEFFSRSRGRVFAEVEETLELKIPKIKTEYENGNLYTKYKFNLFFIHFPLSLSLVPDGEYIEENHENNLYLFNVKLPISVETDSFTRLEPYYVEITPEQAKNEILELLNEIKNNLDDGEEIIHSDAPVLSEDKDFYYVSLDYTVLINIAEEQVKN